MTSPFALLPPKPRVAEALRSAVADDYERFAREGLPEAFEEFLGDRYGLDVSARYAALPLRNPWGKGSGQLSMTGRQVAEDVEAGLGFVVLKTLIAEDGSGRQSMHEWAVPESRMVVEPMTGRSGETGWTVSWRGRGWWRSLEEYLELIRTARRFAAGGGTRIVPSCKFHLPARADEPWRVDEYEFTLGRLLEAWRESGTADEPMPLEKDFSPTLAGSDRAAAQSRVLEWLERVPVLMRRAGGVTVGLKLFNALFDDDFQLDMLRAIHRAGESRPDFYVYGNRLFDPQRTFEGTRGIAYGGPDLSDRNLRVTRRFLEELEECAAHAGAGARGDTAASADSRRSDGECTAGRAVGGPPSALPWSATGNIDSGRRALEYALCGASSFQLHTFFQRPADCFRMREGSRTQKGLHELWFHPEGGFVIWMHHLAEALDLPRGPVRFLDVVGAARRLVRRS